MVSHYRYKSIFEINTKNGGQVQNPERNGLAVWGVGFIRRFSKWLRNIWGTTNKFVALTDQNQYVIWVCYTELWMHR